MTARPVRTRWIRRDEPQPEPESALMKKAKNLPLPGPGVAVDVPLHLMEDYLKLHGLEPLDLGMPPRPFDYRCIAKVKRVPKEKVTIYLTHKGDD
jgi:hypothetical protein